MYLLGKCKGKLQDPAPYALLVSGSAHLQAALFSRRWRPRRIRHGHNQSPPQLSPLIRVAAIDSGGRRNLSPLRHFPYSPTKPLLPGCDVTARSSPLL
jgi:hypothetical protein